MTQRTAYGLRCTAYVLLVMTLILCGLTGRGHAQQRQGLPSAPQHAPVAATERRVALVIGNGAYQFTDRLQNAVNDAQDMAKVLRGLQFQVLLKTDTTLESMAEAVFQFGEQLKGGGVGLFYYSGHGMQVKGENYLIPIDANVQREDEIRRKTISAKDVLDKMDEAKSHLNLVFLDACRNNPFPRQVRSVSRGLASMHAPSGTLLVFATGPDSVASDGTGKNGTYTKHLLHYITQPGLEVGIMLRRVRTAVREETGGQQVPWENGSIEGEFYFQSARAESTTVPPVARPLPPPTSPPAAPPAVPAASPASRTSLGMEFVLIPAGTLQMGSTETPILKEEQPVHTVQVPQPFYLGKHEVTQAQWQAVMGNSPSRAQGEASLPVEQVSWEDVQEFLRRLNARERGMAVYRLPTEAEWEYAARAGTTTAYSFGNNVEDLKRYAWYTQNSANSTHPVGQLQPNTWGVYDMHGNVWEWVQDCFHDSYQGAPTDGSAWETAACPKRVVRGGSFGAAPGGLRAASRLPVLSTERRANLGFRCVRLPAQP